MRLIDKCCFCCVSHEPRPRHRRQSGDHVRNSKRRRATYRYEVVYRREEFSHDYLDHHPARFPLRIAAPDLSRAPSVRTNGHLIAAAQSNYGRFEEFYPPVGLPGCFEPIQVERQSQQPIYQNFGGTYGLSWINLRVEESGALEGSIVTVRCRRRMPPSPRGPFQSAPFHVFAHRWQQVAGRASELVTPVIHQSASATRAVHTVPCDRWTLEDRLPRSGFY